MADPDPRPWRRLDLRLTDLAAIASAPASRSRAAPRRPRRRPTPARLTVELRHQGRPVPITALLGT
jgi:hypothetical protein